MSAMASSVGYTEYAEMETRAQNAEARVEQLESALHAWWAAERRWEDEVNNRMATYEHRHEAQVRRMAAVDQLSRLACEVIMRLPHNAGAVMP